MGQIEAKCPSCGQNVKLDDTKEFIFCTYCGTKIIVKDAVKKADVSEKVESGDAVSYLNLANKAFESKNYIEAYNNYNKVLEYDDSLYMAVFRKGLCAGYLSDETNIRTSEIIDGYNKASELIDSFMKKGNSIDVLNAEHKSMTCELGKFAVNYFGGYMSVQSGHKFKSRDDAQRFVKAAINTSDMLAQINSCIDYKYEDVKKKVLSANIEICDKVLKFSGTCRYVDEIAVDEDGKENTTYADYIISSDTIDLLKSVRTEAVTNYNNLPSNRENMKSLNDTIKNQQTLVAEYKKDVSDFWASNRVKYEGYKAINIQTFVFTTVSIAISLVLVYFVRPVGVALFLVSVAANIVVFIKRKDNYENSNFSEEMLNKKAKYKKDMTILKAKKKEKKRFESTLKK